MPSTAALRSWRAILWVGGAAAKIPMAARSAMPLDQCLAKKSATNWLINTPKARDSKDVGDYDKDKCFISMTNHDGHQNTFISHYSRWKAAAHFIFVLNISIWPNTPHFGDDLVYTAVLYKFPFSIFRILSSVICLFASFIMAKLLFIALARRPALKVDGETVNVFGLKNSEFSIKEIEYVTQQGFGNIFIKISNKRGAAILGLFLVNQKKTWKYLKSIAEVR